MFSPSVSSALDERLRQRLERRVLSATHAPFASNFVSSASCHQFCEVAVGVELRALVVEAVGELVADHHADAAEVRGDGAVLAPKNGGWRMPAGSAVLFARARSTR